MFEIEPKLICVFEASNGIGMRLYSNVWWKCLLWTWDISQLKILAYGQYVLDIAWNINKNYFAWYVDATYEISDTSVAQLNNRNINYNYFCF